MKIRIIFLQLIISFSLFSKEKNNFQIDNTKAKNIKKQKKKRRKKIKN